MAFKQDELIMTRPKCAVQSCEGGGLVMYASKLVCGRCFHKAQENIKKAQLSSCGLVFE